MPAASPCFEEFTFSVDEKLGFGIPPTPPPLLPPPPPGSGIFEILRCPLGNPGKIRRWINRMDFEINESVGTLFAPSSIPSSNLEGKTTASVVLNIA